MDSPEILPLLLYVSMLLAVNSVWRCQAKALQIPVKVVQRLYNISCQVASIVLLGTLLVARLDSCLLPHPLLVYMPLPLVARQPHLLITWTNVTCFARYFIIACPSSLAQANVQIDGCRYMGAFHQVYFVNVSTLCFIPCSGKLDRFITCSLKMTMTLMDGALVPGNEVFMHGSLFKQQ